MAIMQMELEDGPEKGKEPAARQDRAGGSFTLRPYRDADRAELERFYDEFEPQRVAQGLPPTGRARIERWLRTVLAVGVHIVAHRGDRLIGHALVVPADRPGVAEYAVFLDLAERGKGVGVELTRAAVELAREAGFRSLWLTVEPRNRAAVRAYERVGFRFRPATIFSPEAEMTLDLVA